MRSRSTRRTTPKRRSGASQSGLFLALVLTTLLFFPSTALATDVFIDPGHGGVWSGAYYGGIREADVNLWLSLDLRAVLAARGHNTRLSREGNYAVGSSDVPTWHWDEARETYDYYADGQTGAYPIPYDDLQVRCNKANAWGADLFISIHNNAAGSSARGTETYHNWDNPTDQILSQRLASYVQQEICAATGMADRGLGDVGFYVIRWSNMPGVLIEGGFLSNPYDRALLSTPSFRRRMAEGIANGIERFMAEDPFSQLYPRLAGRTRWETAAEIAREGWPDGARTVLLASGTSWPDALAATPLSVKLDAPLLLTRPNVLPEETAAVIEEMAPDEIIVLGGVGAITETATVEAASSAQVALAARVAAGEPGTTTPIVRRIAGPTRYETAAAIAEEVGIPDSGEVVVVGGSTFPDALSASAYAGMVGAPILLTEQSKLSSASAGFLATQETSPTSALIVGGKGVVSTEVFQELRQSMDVVRAAGANRYTTNLAVMELIWPDGPISPYVATGKDFPDALCAGAMAARSGEPVMLLAGKAMSPHQRQYLLHEESRIRGFTMVGGMKVLPPVTEWQLQKAMRRH